MNLAASAGTKLTAVYAIAFSMPVPCITPVKTPAAIRIEAINDEAVDDDEAELTAINKRLGRDADPHQRIACRGTNLFKFGRERVDLSDAEALFFDARHHRVGQRAKVWQGAFEIHVADEDSHAGAARRDGRFDQPWQSQRLRVRWCLWTQALRRDLARSCNLRQRRRGPCQESSTRCGRQKGAKLRRIPRQTLSGTVSNCIVADVGLSCS
jgi:hypothetical protein